MPGRATETNKVISDGGCYGEKRRRDLWVVERPLEEEASELCPEGGEGASLGRSGLRKHLLSRENHMCKGPEVGTGETELGQTLLLLGNQGTGRGGDEQTKAVQPAELELEARAEDTRGRDLCRLRVSAPRPEPSRLRLEERQPPLPELF